jgi:hypothetical protein
VAEKLVYVLQAIPGAGKSTLAEELAGEGGLVLSTDDYFMVDGEYKFDIKEIGAAHAATLMAYIEALSENISPVVVANTNSELFEIAPYYAVAEAFGYTPTILTIIADPVKHGMRNVHGVPLDTLELMARNIENFKRVMPPWWRREIVFAK